MKIHRLEVGKYLTANCYIAENDGKCIIFDACSEADKIQKFINNMHLTPVAIMQTHAHFDHIGAIDGFDLPIYIHPDEVEILHSSKYSYADDVGMEMPNTYSLNLQNIVDCEIIELGGMKIEAIHTPGHTKGSVCLLINDSHLISGDTVFLGTHGRTDLYSGSPKQMLISLKKLFTRLDPNTIIYPGHYTHTTAADESARYLR